MTLLYFLRLNKDTRLIRTRKVAPPANATIVFPSWLVKLDANPDGQGTVCICVCVTGVTYNAREGYCRHRADETDCSSADVRRGRGQGDGAF